VAQWVNALSIRQTRQGCHILDHGKRDENPREWPGNQNGVGGQADHAENYGHCLTRSTTSSSSAARAIVCPGAVDRITTWQRQWAMVSPHVGTYHQPDGFALHSTPRATRHSSPACSLRNGNCERRLDDPGNVLSCSIQLLPFRTYMDMIPVAGATCPSLSPRPTRTSLGLTPTRAGAGGLRRDGKLEPPAHASKSGFVVISLPS